MAIHKLFVLAGRLRGELPAGGTIASLPLEPIPRAKLPTPAAGKIRSTSSPTRASSA